VGGVEVALLKAGGVEEAPVDVRGLAAACGAIVIDYGFDDDPSGLLVELDRGRESGTPPGYDWVSERAANDFAAELLMPARMIFEQYDGSQSAADLADLFCVSQLAMGYRLANLGLR
jgi:hypothetical protein